MAKQYGANVLRRGGPFGEHNGVYRGTIGETTKGQSKDGQWGNTSFQLLNNVAVKATREPGGSRNFVRLTTWAEVEDARGHSDTLMVSDVDPTDDTVPVSLRIAVGQWCEIALALGAASKMADGSIEFNDDLEAFIDEFSDGAFDGTEVEFIVKHRAEKDKQTKQLTGRVFVDTSFPEPEPSATSQEEEQIDLLEDAADTDVTPQQTLEQARARQATTKASGAPKGSGKSKFVRRGQ
jgi:hypothetical protein